MLLKSLLVSFFLPPFVFVLLMAVGLVLLGSRPRFGKSLLWSGLTLLALCAVPIFADLLLRQLETGLPITPPVAHPPAAIIVLGADIQRSEDDMEGAHLGLLSLERLRMGALLGRRTNLPILVSGGLVQSDRPAVADLMAAALEQDFHLQPTWIENKSTTTWENAALSATMLQAQGITSAFVVTHAWHMRRTLIAFAPTGLTVTAVPVAMPGRFEVNPDSFIPTVSTWQYSYYALHEWIGCLWYAFRRSLAQPVI
jgi:uncharacterized SAM-binding protein YcdF (DUF218 family)